MTINDPLYGFIQIPRGVLIDVVNHPYFQRLSRISQLGLASFVYPGARHTRFLHSLGAFHLVSLALRTLADKGQYLFDSEIEATQLAVLLHDVGHGPFSHVLEHTLTRGISHEDISLLAMQSMNNEMNGALSLAIRIFGDEHPKHFLHQLVCSQLDVDRLDYLCRDSFYTGVHEGDIGSARIIQMLNVHDDRLVVDAKGLFSVENYLMARRLMYWQVYLHKTTISAEHILRSALRRATLLARQGTQLFASPSLRLFLYEDIGLPEFSTNPTLLPTFMQLDDSDIITALKAWQHHDDKVLSSLSTAFINRRLFKVREAQPGEEVTPELTTAIARHYHISPDQAREYFIGRVTIEKEMYSRTSEGIAILHKDGTVSEASTLSQIVRTDHHGIHDHRSYIITPKI